MTAKQYLSRACNLRRLISAKELHLMELRTQAEHITADLTGMPRGSGTSSPVERIAVQISDLSLDLEQDWLDLIAYQEEIRKTISYVKDPVLYQLLTFRYICYNSWNEISERMLYSRSHIFRLHTKALGIVDELIR